MIIKTRHFVKIISCILLFIILVFNTNKYVYAKYAYYTNDNIINLSRDLRIANYIINYSEKDNYTNQDVKVLISFDKDVDYLDGFTKIDDYTFEKIYEKNNAEDLIFEDYSGNKSKLNVSVSNIDKEPPKIIGIEEIDNLMIPLKLNYTDNIKVKNIEVKRYTGDLNFRVLDDFYDDKTYYGIDVLDTKIIATIIGRPIGTVKYKYYLDGILKGITDNMTFVFNNLTAMTSYEITVEAIDKNDNVILSRTKNVVTQCFSEVEEYKTDALGIITIKGIYPIVDKIKLNLYSDENPNDVTFIDIGYDKNINEFTFVFNRETFKYTNPAYIYRLHFYFYDKDGKQVSVLPYNLMFGVEPNNFELDIKDVYNLTKSGIYQIIVEDIAGNVTEKTINVK